MQAPTRRLAPPSADAVPVRGTPPQRFQGRLAIALTGFLAQDQDRWVSVVCAAGFALRMGIDWLAA